MRNTSNATVLIFGAATTAAALWLLWRRWRQSQRTERRRLSTAEFCSLAPKLELHVHLDGAFDAPYLYACARKYVDDLPESLDLMGRHCALREIVRNAASEQEFLEEHLVLPPTCAKLTDFLAPFPLSMAIVKAAVRAEGLAPIEELAFLFAKRQHESNAVYTEVRYNPHLFLEQEQLADSGEARYAAAKAVVDAVSRGLRRGEREFNVTLRQMLCCIDFAPEWSDDCARLLKEVGRARGLVAIDVAAGEGHFSAADGVTLQAVRAAKAAGFGVSIHAGEDPNSGGTAANVRRAIEDYGATRIGHGYALLTDPALVEMVRGRGVHLEACPTSSWLTGGFAPKTRPWTEHPICRFCRLGVSCGVNTDDPTPAGIGLSGEWRRCVDDIGMSTDEMRSMADRDVEAAFCSDAEKAALRRRFDAFYTECVVCPSVERPETKQSA